MLRTCELFLKSTHELCQYIITSLLVCCKIFGLVHFTVLPIYEFCNSAANKELLQKIKVFVGAMKSVKAVTRNANEEKRIAKIEGEKTEQSRFLPYSHYKKNELLRWVRKLPLYVAYCGVFLARCCT